MDPSAKRWDQAHALNIAKQARAGGSERQAERPALQQTMEQPAHRRVKPLWTGAVHQAAGTLPPIAGLLFSLLHVGGTGRQVVGWHWNAEAVRPHQPNPCLQHTEAGPAEV